MCTLWKASALKKAVRSGMYGAHSSFLQKCRIGLSWDSAVQTVGHIRDDMSGPSVGHVPLRNSYAIAESSR